jgi:hypothetical protein
MTIWSGIGMNYGHQAVYDPSQADTDFNYLLSKSLTRVRIAMPDYRDMTNIPNCQDMVTRALAKGFYVVWGVTTSGTINATMWNAFKSYVMTTLVPWAQTADLSELSLGNEFELHVDNTTLTATTVRADLRSLASSIKNSGLSSKISYQTSILTTYRNPWAAPDTYTEICR